VWVGDMPGFRAQKFDSNGNFLLAVPNPAQPPPNGGFAQPRGVAVDTNGNIFVTDTNNWRVEKFAQDGSFVTAWGHRGGSTDGFNYERGISVDPTDNSVVVADTDNHMIKKYSNSGTLIWAVGGFGTGQLQFQNPHGVDVGPDGRIYVADTQNARVQVLYPDGTFDETFGSRGFSNGQFQFPRAINVDPIDGTIWVADSIRGIVQHFTNSGVYIGQFGSLGSADTQFLKCSGIVTDANYVYVADADANRVKVWTKSGTFVMAFGVGGTALGGLLKPHGLFLTPDGHLYVAEQSGERVQEFLIQDLVPDSNPPDTAIVAPTTNQTLYSTPMQLSGTATDDVGVTAVKLSIQDRDTLQYWHTDGSWGTFQQFYATVDNPGATNATWSYSWTHTGSPLHFTLQAQAFDAWGNFDLTKASRSFNLSLTPPDTVAPNIAITSPTGTPTFTVAPIQMSGTATDNVGVTTVRISIRNRDTLLYWHTDGSWGTFQQFSATVDNPGAANVTWSYSWTPTGSPLHLTLQAQARDAAGNPGKALANFNFSG
jgi:hypothetical protein